MSSYEDETLSAIEAELSTDKRFATRFAHANHRLSSAAGRARLGSSLALLVLAILLVLGDVGLAQPWLLLPAGLIAVVALRKLLTELTRTTG